MNEFYTPGYERGLRYDDPAFGIKWHLPIDEISEKDRAWPLFEVFADKSCGIIPQIY